MRTVLLGVWLGLALFYGFERCCCAEEDKNAPLWYRAYGEKMVWRMREITNMEKKASLDALTEKYLAKEARDDAFYTRAEKLLRDPDLAVASWAAMYLRNYDDTRLLPALKEAAERWQESSTIWHVYSSTAVNCWTAEVLRKEFWALEHKAGKTGGEEAALRKFRWEMSRWGTEEDAKKLEASLPADKPWKLDGVIGRIRLHRSAEPDKLAFEILKEYEERIAPSGTDFRDYLYHAELIRYLTFGANRAYRPFIERAMEKQIFVSDQVTYPKHIPLAEAWLKENEE